MLIELNGTRLFYTVSGSGPAIIMLHGNGESSKIFFKAEEILKANYTVYRLDTRGHGKSLPVSEYHYEDMSEDVFEFINKLKLEKPIIYGFSDGGIVGTLVAVKYPELLSNLIVSGVNTNPRGIKCHHLLLYKIAYFFTRNKKLKMMISEPAITKEMLSQINLPVIITAGENDLIKASHTEYIHKNIKNSKLKIFKNEGHGSYIVNSNKLPMYLLSVL